MKNIKNAKMMLIVALIFALSLVGCQKDNPEPEKPKLSFVEQVTLKNGEASTIKLNGGNGTYTLKAIEGINPQLLEASISGNTLILKPGIVYGTENVTVKITITSGDESKVLTAIIPVQNPTNLGQNGYGMYNENLEPVLREVKYTALKQGQVWLSSLQGGSPHQNFLKLTALERNKVVVNTKVSIQMESKGIPNLPARGQLEGTIMSGPGADGKAHIKLSNGMIAVIPTK